MAATLPDGLRPIQIEEFGGLQLGVDPDELGFRGAVDLLNVEFQPGVVKSRPGLSVFSSLVSNPVIHLVPFGRVANDEQLVAVTGPNSSTNNLVALNNNGTTFASASMTVSALSGVQKVGTPAATYLYVSNGSASWRRWDGAAWTSPTMPQGTILGLSPTDNRLVVGNIGSPLDASRVMFSDPGVPETFAANNYVSLTPGDGEQIMGMAIFANQLFVFKRSKYFVFFGNSSHFAADGTEVDDFNYRTFANGVGMAGWNCVDAGPDGVYFLDRSGIYKTTGGPPVKVSEALDPFFAQQPGMLFSRSVFQPSLEQSMNVGWAKERLFVTVGQQTAGLPTLHTFVWDPKLDAWSLWTAPGGSSNYFFTAAAETRAVSGVDGRRDVLLGSQDGRIYRLDPTVSTDNGASFTTRYRSGYSDFGNPAREKTIRETELVGTGSPSIAWSREYGSLSSPQSVSLGSSRRGLDRSAHVGELLSYQLSGTAPWSVQRVVPMLREARGVGEETS